jgi:hypothetical protein
MMTPIFSSLFFHAVFDKLLSDKEKKKSDKHVGLVQTGPHHHLFKNQLKMLKINHSL